VSAGRQQRVTERSRAARLARYYHDEQGLAIAEIATLLGRAPATIRSYLYDPDASKVKRVKRRYRGICRRCRASTWGRGPGAASTLCARCNGASTRKWPPAQIEAALRAWYETFGGPASSTDLSLSHARQAAPRDGGARLRRLEAGWAGGAWPPASVVQYPTAPSPTQTASPSNPWVNGAGAALAGTATLPQSTIASRSPPPPKDISRRLRASAARAVERRALASRSRGPTPASDPADERTQALRTLRG
jgi:hypothetical protein